MKKTGKNLPLILVLSALPLCAVIMFLFNFSNKSEKENRLLSYSYSYGGDMTGGSRHTSVSRIDDSFALLSYSHTSWHSQYPEVREYYVPASVLEQISEIFVSYKMKHFSKLRKNPVFAYDKGTSHYSFSFENGENTSFNSNLLISKKGYEGIKKIHDLLTEASKKTECLPGFFVNNSDFDNEDSDIDTFTDGVCNIRIISYRKNCLEYQIANGLPDKLKLARNIFLYKICDGAREEIFRRESSDSFSVNSKSTYSDSVKLEGTRLEEGRYILSVSGYEQEFEISRF